MSDQQQYDKPATFVNVKRVRVDEKDAKGRDRTTITFGLGTDRQGNPTNGLDALIAALLPYQGKQVNLTIYTEEKTSAQGRKFPSAFVKVTEMIPKDQQTTAPAGKSQFVPKTQDRNQAVKNKAEEIRNSFNKG